MGSGRRRVRMWRRAGGGGGGEAGRRSPPIPPAGRRRTARGPGGWGAEAGAAPVAGAWPAQGACERRRPAGRSAATGAPALGPASGLGLGLARAWEPGRAGESAWPERRSCRHRRRRPGLPSTWGPAGRGRGRRLGRAWEGAGRVCGKFEAGRGKGFRDRDGDSPGSGRAGRGWVCGGGGGGGGGCRCRCRERSELGPSKRGGWFLDPLLKVSVQKLAGSPATGLKKKKKRESQSIAEV